MNWKSKKWFKYAEEKNGLRNHLSPIPFASKNTPMIKMFQCLYHPDYTNIELKCLKVKLCNQNILINAEEK